MPSNLTYIGDEAFYYCFNLEEISIPSGVTYIGNYAFEDCEKLSKITFPNDLLFMGASALHGTPWLETQEIGCIINHVLFEGRMSLTELVVPDDIVGIGAYAFDECSKLKKVILPNSVINIGEFAFSNCGSLESVFIPDSVVNIGGNIFSDTEQVVVQCNAGSFAEQYAKRNSINYEILNEHIHSYTAEISKHPTCQSTGIRTYTCSICGDTYTETIAKTAHVYKTTTTKATLAKNGSIVTKCSVCGTVQSSKEIASPKTISLSKSSFTYNGKSQKPKVVVKDKNGNAISASNYTISWSGGCKNVGRYTAKVTFKGSSYSGTVSKTFDIVPKTTSVAKITAKSKGFTVKWKKQASQTSGYQIQYATNKSFKSAKGKTITENKTTQLTLQKLKAKKKYYVRIRTYKTVKVNGKSVKLYSGWSKGKSVTTKR